MANLTLVQAINLALVQEMEADARIMLLGEFESDVASVSVGRPTLEDVFLERTGREFA